MPTRAVLLVALGLGSSGCGGSSAVAPAQVEDTASGAIGNLVVDPCALDFGTVDVGTTTTETYTLENTGTGDLSVLAVTVGLPFTANASVPVVLSPQSRLQFTLVFQPTTFGAFEGELVVQSDDPDAPDVRCTVAGLVDDDADDDGFAAIAAGGTDCDDHDPSVNPGADEAWYDGIDADCDGTDDYDQDHDGWQTLAINADPDLGGGDCQDVDASIHPGATDAPYDGTDSDCDGEDDFDQDHDGYDSAPYGGTDCDDADATVNPGATEDWDGADQNCDGTIDEDIDASTGAEVTVHASESGEGTGSAIDVADLDGNGLAEMIVGSPFYVVSGSTGRGRVSVFPNESWDPVTTVSDAVWTLEGVGATDAFGSALWVAQDPLGDGEAGLVIGAPGTNAGSGAIYVFAGDDVALASIDAASWTLSGFDDAQVGVGVGGGDLDGDGRDDVASWSHDLALPYNYLALVYGGGAGGDLAFEDADMVWMELCGTQPVGASVRGCGPGATPARSGTTSFGTVAHGANDLDGDGYDDLLVADPYAEAASRDEGIVWILWGRESAYTGWLVGFDATAQRLAIGTVQDDALGRATGIAPDADGDGDLEIWMTLDATDEILVLTGETDLRAGGFAMPGDATERIEAGSATASVGFIRGTGDWTGDGVGDVIVAQNLDPDRNAGQVFLLPAMAWTLEGDLDDVTAWKVIGGGDGAELGAALPPASRDANGDGRADLVLGDPTGDKTLAGRAHVFHNHHGAP